MEKESEQNECWFSSMHLALDNHIILIQLLFFVLEVLHVLDEVWRLTLSGFSRHLFRIKQFVSNSGRPDSC